MDVKTDLRILHLLETLYLLPVANTAALAGGVHHLRSNSYFPALKTSWDGRYRYKRNDALLSGSRRLWPFLL